MEEINKSKMKKKRLAPLKKPETKPDPVKEEDDFEFTDEMLDELLEASENLNTSDNLLTCSKTNDELIDLDDCMPTSVQPKSLPSLPHVNKETLVPKKAPVVNRKEMLFSSIEHEEDTTLKLRFMKRNVPASRLKELSSTMKQISLYESLKQTADAKNWFTYGVVVEYDKLRTSAGCRIDLTDLATEPYTVRFLLFGTASDLGPISVGTIVCILNPTKGKPYSGREALIVKNQDQLLVAGTSRDFGFCSGTKKAGGSCRAVVNLKFCRLCKHHALAEYKGKQVAKDLRAAAAGVGLPTTPKSPGIWNAQVSQGRPLNTAKKNLALMKKDSERLNKLSATAVEKRIDASPIAVSSAKKRHLEIPAPTRVSAAKRRALEYVRQNGTIPEGTLRKKPEPEVEKPKPAGITDKFLALMREKPRDPELLKEAEKREQEKKFDRLAVVEEISEKLAATHEVPVRAIRCLVCQKTFHQMPLQCVMNKHKCRVVMGTKRFFECNSCRNRTSTLERMPATECSKCGVWSWKRSGVAPNPICNAAPQLSVRGLEEKFINSIVKEPNLNLLLPDE